MTDTSANNKRIAKNTLMLYIRMILSTIVTLYTSRVVLNTLGVDDYGIYNVVGGVVAMFTFLNSSMSGATSRFLTYEIGRNDNVKLLKTFSSALYIHIAIALLILLVAEPVGLWLLENKLVIPEDRMLAAHIVYQCSILSMVVTVTQVPYNASIIAHEKMDVYAYVELLNVFLKLGIVFILMIWDIDKLILYAILVLAVSVLIALIYRFYCIRKFDECHLNSRPDKNIIIPMLKFSCWDLYGNMSVSVRQQGTSILLNMFYGPALNAANGIATSVHGVIMNFANNVVMAFRPQIIKSYASNDINRMFYLIINASKYTLCLFLLVGVPLFFELDYILQLWLKTVPDYTAIFLRIILVCSIFKLANGIINIGIHATGQIKRLSFISGTLSLLNIPIFYIAMYYGCKVNLVYEIMIPFDFLIFCSSIYIFFRLVKSMKIKALIIKGYLPSFGLLIILSPLLYLLQAMMPSCFGRLVLSSLISLIISSIYAYTILFTKEQRIRIKETVYITITKYYKKYGRE